MRIRNLAPYVCLLADICSAVISLLFDFNSLTLTLLLVSTQGPITTKSILRCNEWEHRYHKFQEEKKQCPLSALSGMCLIKEKQADICQTK